MNKVSKELAKQAKANGICAEWHADLKQMEDIEKLLDMYISGIDFCLSNDYPSNDYIRANFKGKMEHRGVFLDHDLKVAGQRTVVALGSCTGEVYVSGYDVSEIYLKHDSEIVLHVSGNSFAMVDMFDNSKLSIVASDNAKVCINHYGGEFIMGKRGNAVIKIREKNKKTY
jgi:hypothetical protein